MTGVKPAHRYSHCSAFFVVCCLFASPGFAIECGDTLGPGAHDMDADLSCNFPAGTPSLVLMGDAILNMHDHTLTCLADPTVGPSGDGIWLEGAHNEVTTGNIEGCGVAVELRGQGGHVVHFLNVSGDGGFLIYILSDNSIVHDVVASLGDGAFVVVGDWNAIIQSQTLSAQGNGFWIQGNHNLFADISAIGAVCSPVTISGAHNHFEDSDAQGGSLCPTFEIAGPGNILERTLVLRGAQDGLVVRSDGNQIRASFSDGNAGSGIIVRNGFTGNEITGSEALDNGGFDLVDENPNCDHNIWSANQFRTANASCIFGNVCSGVPSSSHVPSASAGTPIHNPRPASPARNKVLVRRQSNHRQIE